MTDCYQTRGVIKNTLQTNPVSCGTYRSSNRNRLPESLRYRDYPVDRIDMLQEKLIYKQRKRPENLIPKLNRGLIQDPKIDRLTPNYFDWKKLDDVDKFGIKVDLGDRSKNLFRIQRDVGIGSKPQNVSSIGDQLSSLQDKLELLGQKMLATNTNYAIAKVMTGLARLIQTNKTKDLEESVEMPKMIKNFVASLRENGDIDFDITMPKSVNKTYYRDNREMILIVLLLQTYPRFRIQNLATGELNMLSTAETNILQHGYLLDFSGDSPVLRKNKTKDLEEKEDRSPVLEERRYETPEQSEDEDEKKRMLITPKKLQKDRKELIEKLNSIYGYTKEDLNKLKTSELKQLYKDHKTPVQWYETKKLK